MSFQAVCESRIVCFTCAGTRVDHDVHGGQLMLMKAKRFAHQTFHAIAPDRIAHESSGDRQTEPRMGTIIMPRKNGEEVIGEATRVFVDAIEFGFMAKALCRGERPRVNLQVGDGQCTRRG
jgi:hypothetical protein